MEVIFRVELPWFKGYVVLSKNKAIARFDSLADESDRESFVSDTEHYREFKATGKGIKDAIDHCLRTMQHAADLTYSEAGGSKQFLCLYLDDE